LQRAGLEDVAEQGQRGLLKERIDVRAGHVGAHDHVALVDGLPARNRGAVEHRAFLEIALFEHVDVERDVLHFSAKVVEAKINELNFLILDELHHVAGSGHRNFPQTHEATKWVGPVGLALERAAPTPALAGMGADVETFVD
jgi:hypothetical protein